MTSFLPHNAHIDYVLSLADILPHDAERTGAKAAKVGELMRAGFPVPDGCVLTINAFDRFLAANAFGPDSSPEAVAAASMPTVVVDALLAAAEVSGDVPWQSAHLGSPKTYLRPRSPGSTKRSLMCTG